MQPDITIKCRVCLRKPCHVGFGKKRQIKDFRKKPFIPAEALKAQVYAEMTCFAGKDAVDFDKITVSNAITPEEPVLLTLKDEEFFRNTLYFSLTVPFNHLVYALAALKSLQNTGYGANTSQGLGYNSVAVLTSEPEIPPDLKERFDIFSEEEEEFYDPFFVKLTQSVLQRVKKNWTSWLRSRDHIGCLERRTYYRLTPKEKRGARKLRSALRRKMLENTGVEHQGDNNTCHPKHTPCRVCSILGSMGTKSKIIAREFLGKEQAVIVLICDNLSEDEKNLLERALAAETPYQLESEETRADYMGQ